MKSYPSLKKLISKAILAIFAAISCLSNGDLVLAHNIDDLPPFDFREEELVVDPEFSDECKKAAKIILQDISNSKVLTQRISKNAKLGTICRFDFSTPNDREGAVNRVTFWRLRDGVLAEFIGLDIPAPPLE